MYHRTLNIRDAEAVNEVLDPLTKARDALAQARRVFDDLVAAERSLQDFRDRMPYMLDRLDNVWRRIENDSRGIRTQAFSTWWAKQWEHDHRKVVRFLRNLELKDSVFVTKAVFTYKSLNYIEVGEDGTFSVREPDGTELPRTNDGNLDVGRTELDSSAWYFNVGGIDDQPAKDVVRILLDDLENRVLPTAERLLAE